ncbi:hypothetical protein MTX38_32570, partial [Rhodococcus sp. ARC_M13]|uniref:hypothetical protein n=1 Tax=Rhodococcus sp. ARC_M13 TaxID=2928855 RepID=UPI001FB1ED10
MDADKLPRITADHMICRRVQYIDILLGPERTRECFLEGSNDNVQARSYRKNFFLVGVCLEPECCVLFENCTVDASIFVVSNEERTVDALAPGA